MIEHTEDLRRVLPFRRGNLDPRQESYYLLEVESHTDVGLWYFCADYDLIGMHANFPLGGERAATSARAAIRWVFHHTNHKVVIAAIPAEFKHAQVMAVHVGFEFYTIDKWDHRCYFCTPATLGESEALKWAA